jgi:hypothetical protein
MCACKKVCRSFCGFFVFFEGGKLTKQDMHQILFVETAVFFFSEKTISSGVLEYIKEDTKREKED